MMSTARKVVRGGRLRLVVAGAVVLTALTTATASASPLGTPAPRTQLPVFVLDKGRFTVFDAPGQGAAEFQRINNRGQVVGAYIKQQLQSESVLGGYLRDRRGPVTTFDVPGAASTTPLDLNDRGDIVGVYAPTADPSVLHGFLLRRGRYTTFDPDARALTLPLGINNRGQIAGYTAARFEATREADAHGFVLRRGPGGPVTRIDVPGALGTGAMGIDDRGRIVGVSINPDAMPGAPMGRMS